MLLVRSGKARIFLDESWREPTGATLFVTPPGRIHGFRFSPDVDGHVLTVSSRFLQDFGQDDPAANLLSGAGLHDLDESLADKLHGLAVQIVTTSHVGEAADMLRRALAEAFVRTAAVDLAHPDMAQDDPVVRRFQGLVAAHGREQRTLAFYAKLMDCTERTLNRRVREALDVTPMQYLHERLAADATRLLRFTNASCADVADELGFADPSYFSRFYLRMTGHRPGAVRGSTRSDPDQPAQAAHSAPPVALRGA